jgi:branched-chain amino acid aminotransferase
MDHPTQEEKWTFHKRKNSLDLIMSKIWSNGKIIDQNDFRISPLDRGLTLGLGVFETMAAIDGNIRYFERHMARLSKATEYLGLKKIDREQIIKGISDLCEIEGLKKARVRLAITAGEGSLKEMKAGEDSCTWMIVTPLPNSIPATILIVPWRRNEHSALMGVKSASYAENIIAQSWVNERGSSDAIFLNTAGDICEAATSNIFFLVDNCLITPCVKCGCLPGVMRDVVIETAKKLGVKVVEEKVSLEMVEDVNEVFLTSAIRGVNWVKKWEDKFFEKEGVLTEKIRKLIDV